MRLIGIQMELENTMVSEVTQTQKNIHGIYSLKMDISQKPKTKQNQTKQTTKNTEYTGYSPQNSKISTSCNTQVKMPRS